jgi:predicted nucleotidyltransferase
MPSSPTATCSSTLCTDSRAARHPAWCSRDRLRDAGRWNYSETVRWCDAGYHEAHAGVVGEINSGVDEQNLESVIGFNPVPRDNPESRLFSTQSIPQVASFPIIMATALDEHRDEIAPLCRRYGVARLELFGSATTDRFDSQRSDLDFLVEFDSDSSRLFDRYFGLKESLESLFGRRIDLVTAGSLRNPYFIEAVNKTRQLVYVAEDTEAA